MGSSRPLVWSIFYSLFFLMTINSISERVDKTPYRLAFPCDDGIWIKIKKDFMGDEVDLGFSFKYYSPGGFAELCFSRDNKLCHVASSSAKVL